MRVIIALIFFSVTFAKAEDSTQVSVDFVKGDSTANDENVFIDYAIPKVYVIDETSNVNFDSPIANPYEPRIGFIGQPSDKRLRMDIGTTIDLLEISSYSTFGIDMMTYTRLRSEGRFKFPVETTDYYFGVNSAFNFYDKPIFGWLFNDESERLRIRLAHISSHLIDGYTTNNEFITEPFVYSREFLEVIYKAGHTYSDFLTYVSPYLGVNYIFSKIPNNIESFEFISGLDAYIYLTDGINIMAGYNFTLKGFDDKYYGVSNAQAGLNFHLAKGRSIFIGIYAHDGLSMHGMFFNQKDSYIGIGTQVYYF